MCSFSGKLDNNFSGDKFRHICVSEESGIHGEEACRYESVKGLTDVSIVRAHDDTKQFCLADKKFKIGEVAEPIPEVGEDGSLTQEAQDKY